MRLFLLSPCPPYGEPGTIADVPDDEAAVLLARVDAELAAPHHPGWTPSPEELAAAEQAKRAAEELAAEEAKRAAAELAAEAEAAAAQAATAEPSPRRARASAD